MAKRKNGWITGIVLMLLLMSCVLAITAGAYHIPLERILPILSGHGGSAENLALLDNRLPRMLMALLVGTALAMSGSILQTVTKNPLAEPGMIGINAGAAFAVVLFIAASKTAYYETLSVKRMIAMPLISMAGGLIAGGVIYVLSNRKGIRPVRLILVGIGINTGINAMISYFQLTSSRGDFQQVLTWTNGSLWGTSWLYVKMVALLIAILAVYVACKLKVLNVLQLGDELATGLGVRVQKETKRLFFAAVLLASIATSVAGNIAFLGLLGPQIGKSLVGGRMSWLLPVSSMISAVILIVADTIARNAFSPIELPVGIVVSVLGVPYFVYLMLKAS